MQWLDDEEQVAESDEDVQAILQLYDLAVTDYLCKGPKSGTLMEAINIWTRYLKFIQKYAEILAKVIDLDVGQFSDLCFKKAIAATQYHIPEVP
jgi:hypothetical protein